MNNEKYKLWWDENLQLARAELLTSEINLESTLEFKKDVFKIIEQHQNNVKGLIKIISGLTNVPTDIRKVFAEILRHPGIKKVAFYADKILPAPKIILIFIIKASSHQNAKIFSSEEEAIKWLKG